MEELVEKLSSARYDLESVELCDLFLSSEDKPDAQSMVLETLELAHQASRRKEDICVFLSGEESDTFCWIVPSEKVVFDRVERVLKSIKKK